MSDEQRQLCADLVAHRISRAGFLRRAAALGLSAPAAASLLAACGSGSGAGSSAVGASGGQVGTAVTTPAPSGEVDLVKWALFYEPSSLDWIFAYNYEENTVAANVTESLMRITPQFTLEPALAESFSRPDPSKLAYTIRQGVKFGDGSPMTTEDVVFSLRRNLDPNSFWWFAFEEVEAVDQTGPNEVTISSKSPNELLHWLMATPAGGVGKAAEIKSKGKSYGTPAAGPVGTGPFAFKSWNQGASITLVRNESYWDTAHRPRVRQIDFSFIPEESTMTSALLSGQVDGAYHTPYSGLNQLRSAGSGNLYLGKSMIFTGMYIAATSGPLTDPAVRNAIVLATDRAALAKTVYNGAAAPLRDTLIAPSMWGYAQQAAASAYRTLPGSTPDLGKAKALASKSSAPARPIVIATRASLQRYIQIATIIQDAARKVGLDARIKTISPNDYGDLFFSADARKGIDLFVSENYIDVPEPLELIYTVTPQPANGVSYNYNDYNDPVVTRAMRSALGQFDDDKRAQLILGAQKRMASAPPVLPLVNPAVPLFLNKRLTGAPASFCYLYYPWARDLGAA